MVVDLIARKIDNARSLPGRQEIAKNDKHASREYPPQADHLANQANDYANNYDSVKNEVITIPDNINKYIPNIRKSSTDANSMILPLRNAINSKAKTVETQTIEEKNILKEILNNAMIEIDVIDEKVKDLASKLNESISAVNTIKSAANGIHQNTDRIRSFANQARHHANITRSDAEKCARIQESGDHGDNEATTKARNSAYANLQLTTQLYNAAKQIYESTVSIKNNGNASLTKVIGYAAFADQTAKSIKESVDEIQIRRINEIQDFANSYNYDYLYSEIERIKPLLNTVETVTLPNDEKDLVPLTEQKTEYDGLLSKYIADLQIENLKGSFAQQTNTELAELQDEINACNGIVKLHDTSSNIISQLIDNDRTEIDQKLKSIGTKREENERMNHTVGVLTQKFNDLSGELIDLRMYESLLRDTLTSEQQEYIDLNNHIKNLEKKIIELKIEDYSSKVHNNTNLLELNTTIDKDLQNIFSHLRTENINPDLLYTKIKYRRIEEEKLSNINKLLDLLFYCFYFSFIIIRIVTRNTKTDDFLMYILIGIIPFIYPIIYKNSKYVMHLFHLDMNKNALIETEPEISIDAYNI
jgi:chromosome segregation ATPase